MKPIAVRDLCLSLSQNLSLNPSLLRPCSAEVSDTRSRRFTFPGRGRAGIQIHRDGYLLPSASAAPVTASHEETTGPGVTKHIEHVEMVVESLERTMQDKINLLKQTINLMKK